MKGITKIAKAIGWPIIPLVPECCYCAAMRWSFLSCILTGALYDSIKGALVGVAIGCGIVFCLWVEYRVMHHE